jgi:hypothetical protein
MVFILVSALLALQEPVPQDAALPAGREQEPWWEQGDEMDLPIDFGLVFDFFAAFSEKSNSANSYNELRVRSAQLHFFAPVDEVASLFATADFADPGDGGDFVLREAAARIQHLPLPIWPQNFHLLVGQYFADLGAWNTVLANEFPAPQLDGVRRAYLGGNLAARGIEAHHSLPFRDGNFRWSLGLASEVEGQNVDANEYGVPADPAAPAGGRYGISNATATGRTEMKWFLGADSTLRLGASGLYAPNEVLTTSVPGTGTVRDETTHWLGGFDAGYRWQVSEEASHEFSFEMWLDDSEYRVGTPSTLVEERGRGEWLMYEYVMNRNWSFGGLVSRFEQPTALEQADASYDSLWASYRFSPANRFSFFVTHNNPAPGEEKWYSVGGQWVFALGAPRQSGRRP